MAFLQIINIKMNLKGSLLKKSEALYFSACNAKGNSICSV